MPNRHLICIFNSCVISLFFQLLYHLPRQSKLNQQARPPTKQKLLHLPHQARIIYLSLLLRPHTTNLSLLLPPQSSIQPQLSSLPRYHRPVSDQLLWVLLSVVPILVRMEERVLYQATFAFVQNTTCGTCALFMLVSALVGGTVQVVTNTVFCFAKGCFSHIFTYNKLLI